MSQSIAQYMVARSLTTFMLASIFTLAAGGCDDGIAVNHWVYRSNPGEDLELMGGGCFAAEAGGGAGGGTNEYAVREHSDGAGGITLTYLLDAAAADPEYPLDDSDPNLSVAAILSLSEEQLASGQHFIVEFDRADGAHFEVIHWGTPDCEGDLVPPM